jgi:hypothetical protein
MHSATFIGEVQQGRLHIGQPLADFEGKHVLVTLIAPDILLPLSGSASMSAPRLQAALEAEILEDAGRIRAAPRASQTIDAKIVVVGRRSPHLGVEEE